ncbi:PEPxxWA-CTERM sorting domain-containing protein [Glacieibacterium frigidum]|uniref:PEPxxWA-CTERM sorting domain-containing protein n=1 Tax=Glacieibacterium frigidum TaxID=2593303 RepID=UPI001F1D3937|nr:PEPxxWA-CTERM sorting domain-containing protein [Glacieibacterium frigidum]
MMIRHAVLVAAATLACSSAHAATINPTSYDMIDGGAGVFQYQDDTYNGTRAPNGYLSGGVGELTDGVVAAGPWNVTPGPYVGWRFISPEIVFNFAPLSNLANATFRFDNAQGVGNVFLPDSLSFDFGGGFVQYTPTVTFEGNLGVFSYDFTGISASTFTVRIDSEQEWFMLTEVDFDGTLATAVPEPGTWAMLIAGFGAVGAMARRRRGATVTA